LKQSSSTIDKNQKINTHRFSETSFLLVAVKRKMVSALAVENGKLVGLVTFRDFFRAEPTLMQTIRGLMKVYGIRKSLSKVAEY
jgi:CBS domain-containing protein